MTETRVAFDDADAYERYMGRWSRAIGESSSPGWIRRMMVPGSTWVAAPARSPKLVLSQAAPKNIIGIDPSPAQVEHACKAVGLRRPTRLTFRRTHSAWAHDKGIPPKVVAANMGQPRSDTTINVYTQVLDGAVRDAADRVGSELFTIFHNQAGATALTD